MQLLDHYGQHPEGEEMNKEVRPAAHRAEEDDDLQDDKEGVPKHREGALDQRDAEEVAHSRKSAHLTGSTREQVGDGLRRLEDGSARTVRVSWLSRH